MKNQITTRVALDGRTYSVTLSHNAYDTISAVGDPTLIIGADIGSILHWPQFRDSSEGAFLAQCLAGVEDPNGDIANGWREYVAALYASILD